MSAQAALNGKVVTLWEEVIRASNRVLAHHAQFGFELITVVPNPNIFQMLTTLRAFASIMDMIIANMTNALDHDHARMILNAREQLRRMERVALALHLEDQELYQAAIREMELQAPL